jgi:hypothetical protein
MHLKIILNSIFGNALKIDKRIVKTLWQASQSLVLSRQLSISTIGRLLERDIKVKHNIKCIDRLFGNKALYEGRTIFYQKICKRFITEYPLILIDWSGLSYCGKYYILRASIATKGRAVTLYEEVHERKNHGSIKIHKKFLITLKDMMPESTPIIITDAGFRCTWFKAVIDLKWHFVGRVRHNAYYFDLAGCKRIESLNPSVKPQVIPNILLTQGHKLECDLYMVKKDKKYRIRKNLAGKKIECSTSKKHAKGGREPWIIASNLDRSKFSAKQIIHFYSQRMQIEESFRDSKSPHFGLGLRICRSNNIQRLSISLLIATITAIALYLTGIASKEKKMDRGLQVHSLHHKKTLSDVTIGWLILMRDSIIKTQEKITAKNIRQAIVVLTDYAKYV